MSALSFLRSVTAAVRYYGTQSAFVHSEAVDNISAQSKVKLDDLAKRVIVPSLSVTDEELSRARHQDLGQNLARQEDWDKFCSLFQKADQDRTQTIGGEPATLLMALGARHDVVASAEAAIMDNVVPDPYGMDAMETVFEDYSGAYPIALTVALAHFDIGWAWRINAPKKNPDYHIKNAVSHIQRAQNIIKSISEEHTSMASVLAAQCTLSALNPNQIYDTQGFYLKLITAHPQSQRHMRALGQMMMPKWVNDKDALEVTARRVAAMTQDVWNAGGYTWCYLDALSLDQRALEMLDLDFFIEGMNDIFDQCPDQHVVNQFAAFCALSMTREMASNPAADNVRAKLHDCLEWILTDFMHELHPLVWTQTLLSPGLTVQLPSRKALVAKGRETALRAIAARFADKIEDGSSIAFSPAGMYVLPTL